MIERLTKRIEKTETCWIWTGGKSHGYGMVTINSRVMMVHRAMYEIYKGPIPDRYVIDHLCRNPSCVNPDHLEAVTERENILRGNGATAINARKTACSNGHEYTKETCRVVETTGERRCRVCEKANKAGWKARQ